jgi:hypothetical protein
MLFLLVPVLANLPVAVDVAGMEPQIGILRRDAAEHGWRITCEGRSGEERVLRLTFPQGASAAAIRTYFDAEHHVGSSSRFYYPGDLPPAGCNREPPTATAPAPMRVLGFGPARALTRLAGIARACGFTRAAIRAQRTGDFPAATARRRADWLTLDAGEDMTPRYGPTICFIQMRGRALPELQQQARRPA